MIPRSDIPDDAQPADIAVGLDVLAGQSWLVRAHIVELAQAMLAGTFDWVAANEDEPMSVQIGLNGRVISQGHHRIVAAHIAAVQIPVLIEELYDFWPGPVPYARSWNEVHWE